MDSHIKEQALAFLAEQIGTQRSYLHDVADSVGGPDGAALVRPQAGITKD